MPPARLNHAVLYVRDAEASAAWYCEHLDFEVVHRLGGAVFLTCADSSNDHDLGLFSIGAGASPSNAGRQSVGLYHLAWEVPTLAELANLAERLREAGALTGASDHGPSKSLYCHDLDGIEFELFWAVPFDLLDPVADELGVRPLDLTAEIERFGAETAGRITYSPR